MPKDRVRENPRLTAVFAALYGAECLTCIHVLRDVRIAGHAALAVLPAAMVVVLLVLRLSKACGAAAARAFGANRVNCRKFSDQTWQLVIHGTMTALELHVLRGETWYEDPSAVFKGYSPGREVKASAMALYVVQLAIWIITCFSHHALEARHKDFYLMYAHHLVTIALILLSWSFSFVEIGVTVLYVHDASDITIDLLKMANYLKWEGPKHLFAVEAIFVANLASWTWWRIYQLPFRIVKACIVDGFMALYDQVCLGKPWVIPGCYGFIYLLLALCLMHAWWLYLLLRIAARLLLAPGKTHDAGRTEYEGDSSEEEEEEGAREAEDKKAR